MDAAEAFAEGAMQMDVTAAAKSIVWRGVVNFPAGSYGLSFGNNAGNRSYLTTFTISASQANTDVLVTAVVPGDTAGAWIVDSSGAGLWGRLCLAAGSNYQTANTGVWQSGNFLATPAQTNGMVNTDNVFELADIGLYEGSELPTWELPDYKAELMQCRRYWRAYAEVLLSAGVSAYGGAVKQHDLSDMRAVTPALSIYIASYGGSWSGGATLTYEVDTTTAYNQRSVRVNPANTQPSSAYAAYRVVANARL